MRRIYIVISSFFVATFLLVLFCFGSYQYSEKITEKRAEEQKKEVQETVRKKEKKVTSDTRYILEIYNRDTEELVREERTVPAEYAGMTRQELESFLSRRMDSLSRADEEAGLEDMKLMSFSGDEIVIRKTYKEPAQEEGFFLRLTGGEIGIYDRSGKRLRDRTGIMEEDIPEDEAERLRTGYVVENEKELYSILENFSS